jgi:putative GTP pyrophosphokinase
VYVWVTEESPFLASDGSPPLAEITKADLAKSQEFDKEYQFRKPTYDRACVDLEQELKRLIEDLGKQGLFRARLAIARVKEAGKVREKANRYKIPLHNVFDRLDDLVGVRIVCNNLEDIDKVIEAVTKSSQWKLIRVDGPEKVNHGTTKGYRGRNIVVETVVYQGYDKVNVLAEIQVRTLLQDAWAHLSHDDFYKPDETSPPTWLDKQMRRLSDDLHMLDTQAQFIRGAVEKRYVDIRRSLGFAVVSKIDDHKQQDALRDIIESMSRREPGMQLAAVETFLQNRVLWHIGMCDFAAAAKMMDEWVKIRLLEKLSALSPEEALQFAPVITALVGD